MEDLLVWLTEPAMVASHIELIRNLVQPLKVLYPVPNAWELVEELDPRPVILRPLLLVRNLHLLRNNIVEIYDLLEVDSLQVAHEVTRLFQIMLDGLSPFMQQDLLCMYSLVATANLIAIQRLLRVKDASYHAIR